MQFLKVAIAFLVLSSQHYDVLGDETCSEIPNDICPYEVSELTGKFVKLVPKYLPRDHPEYDVRTPEEARDKLNLYCAHPACYPQPCLNGGTCMEELEGYSCSCSENYTGTRCEYHVDCPVGWLYGKTKCFLVEEGRTWQGARDYCNGLEAVTIGNGTVIGPSLLFLESTEEYQILKHHLTKKSVWINCSRLSETWACYRDREGTTSSYRNWGVIRGEDKGDCVQMWLKNGKMHLGPCTVTRYTVCQLNL